MAHIAALLLILALFYFWLIGNWFARGIVFVVLGAVLGVAFAEIALSALQIGYNPPVAILLLCVGWLIAWPVSQIPLYLRRRHDRQNSAVRAMIV